VVAVNVYAEDLGWLLEDLKRHFAALDGPARRVLASERPLKGADAWVALRTQEAGASPDLARTLVCVHDLFDGGLYAPGGPRATVRGAGGLALSHPGQRRILDASGISCDGRVLVERPLGALSIFQLREPRSHRSGPFSIGWVGRNHPRKRLPWFVESVLALAPPREELRAVLLGEGLEGAAGSLRAAGVECSLHPRDTHPVAEYPRVYQGLDALVITGETEAGPLPLFEALASGVPVVSTPVGWAPLLAPEDSPWVRIAGSPAEIAAHLDELRPYRDEMFERRRDAAALVSNWTLEGWVSEVLQAADALAAQPGLRAT